MASALKIAKWYDPLYGTTYVIVVGSADEARRYLKKDRTLAPLANGWLKDSVAWTQKLRANGCFFVVIWLSKHPSSDTSMSTLVHELLHAMCYTFRRVGIKLGKKSEESHAYYLQWLLEESLKRL